MNNLGITLLDDINTPLDVNEYYYRRNPKIRQLPASKEVIKAIYYSGTNSKLKAKIRSQLNKGDTMKAVELFLRGSYPKSIKKYFLNNTNHWDLLEKDFNNPEEISILSSLLKVIDINLIVRCLNNNVDPKHCYNIVVRLDEQYDFKTIIIITLIKDQDKIFDYPRLTIMTIIEMLLCLLVFKK